MSPKYPRSGLYVLDKQILKLKIYATSKPKSDDAIGHFRVHNRTRLKPV